MSICYNAQIFHTHTHFMRNLSSVLLVVAMLVSPLEAAAQKVLVDSKGPIEQDFILTAYYSPLPDQCCYVKGSYEDDKILNGEGTHGADGTPVYPGMLAAPPSYPFGTRIVLPGLGTFTVHDRGGAIKEWDKAHRLDVWAGHGEVGLARALAFGVQSIRGQVYLPGTQMPDEQVSLEALDAPLSRIQPYAVKTSTTGLVASAGQIDPTDMIAPLPVQVAQEKLAALGYFHAQPTGVLGDATQAALQAFIKDMGLEEPADSITEKTAAYIDAAMLVSQAPSPIVFVGKESVRSDITKMQRMLRYLGFYRGRTDGVYSEKLFTAIFEYQKSVGLVSTITSPGAGNIGPLTKAKLDEEVKHRRIARQVKRLMSLFEVKTKLAEADALLATPLSVGANGQSVRILQKILADAGLFPIDLINGNYGERTKKAVADFQVALALLGTTNEKGAGTVGPITLRTLQQKQAEKALSIVNANGWEAFSQVYEDIHL